MAALLTCVLSVVPITNAGAAPPMRESLAFVPYNEAHPVLAYYYAWWEPEKLTSGLYQAELPLFAGARDISDDPNLERAHVNQARSAGIDGFIVNRTADLARMLDLTRGSDFRVTLQLDSNADVESQLAEFYAHADDQGIVTAAGHPTLFFWRVAAHPDTYWSGLRDRFDPDHHALWIADGDQFGVLASDAWDGISPYAIAWSPNPAGQLPSWAAKSRAVSPDKLYIPPVSPGCDDSRDRAAPTCVRDRGDGSYYQAALNGALASNPRWAVVVSTWNEWMEATSIEPSVQYGDLYLQLTRQFADTFKAL